jgi:acyl carrier protein phosphodiesterase
MNYLAHAYLSFGDPDITVGNMISDYVKGRKILDYPERVRQGIMLHRSIDQFTDHHPATRNAKEVFRPHYRLYSAAFVDVVYDHFLAMDSARFGDPSLMEFSLRTYAYLDTHSSAFPEPFARMFPYMKSQNWLYNYQFRWGLRNSFGGLVRRARFLEESETAFRLFETHADFLLHCYQEFMPDVQQHAENHYRQLHRES